MKSLIQTLESSETCPHLTLLVSMAVSIVTLGILNNRKTEGDLECADVGGGQRGCPGAATLADPPRLRVLTLLDQGPAPGALWPALPFSGLWRGRDTERRGGGGRAEDPCGSFSLVSLQQLQ